MGDRRASGPRFYGSYYDIPQAPPQAPAPQRPPVPKLTYTLLGILVAFYILELIVAGAGGAGPYAFIFAIDADWPFRPWSLITSTLSHSLADLSHLLFNGLFLFFFGPTIEHLIGGRKFVGLFLGSGALSGILQVTIDPGPALGASGALMALLGVTLILTPKAKLIIFPFPVPVPLWVAGVVYAAWDILGAFFLSDNIGHFAHLSGLAVGLLYGVRLKGRFQRRGLRVEY